MLRPAIDARVEPRTEIVEMVKDLSQHSPEKIYEVLAGERLVPPKGARPSIPRP
jgi:hypothetical protein